MDTARAVPAGIASGEPAPAGDVAPHGTVAPHQITLAVWGMPEAVAAGERFTIKVGAKSSAGADSGVDLGRGRIALRNSTGAIVASGFLSGAAWPGTSALFWAEVELQAPAAPGVRAFSADFDASDLDPPHSGASFRFDVTVVEPPEHIVTVKVTDKETAAPVAEAQVRLGPHRAVTDASGLAEMRTAKCRFDLRVWKAGYDAPVVAVDIDGDTFVQVDVTAIPEEDPDARWTG
jgi:hypothetical protein